MDKKKSHITHTAAVVVVATVAAAIHVNEWIVFVERWTNGGMLAIW